MGDDGALSRPGSQDASADRPAPPAQTPFLPWLLQRHAALGGITEVRILYRRCPYRMDEADGKRWSHPRTWSGLPARTDNCWHGARLSPS